MTRFVPSTDFLTRSEKHKTANTTEHLLDKFADELLGYHPDAYHVLDDVRHIFQDATPDGFELELDAAPLTPAQMLQGLYGGNTH